ncbi:MAG: dihydroorotate dehydrogenase electron transfer subunit [Verrucomicrobia bacterium]|nr:dihydroorotate dehydrogenase electron transfer subunit [Verrucomicrobiota bacterium]MDA1086295.1 dihydroorotate dehydrogenase electron transfer subunit [Verrucomicrobiota bacterium]
MKTDLSKRAMRAERAVVTRHELLYGEYRVLQMHVPAVARAVQPGQFVHLEIPGLDDAILRRPFSVFKADDAMLSVLYKPVGKGTRAMTSIRVDDEISLIGPLGHGFPTSHDVAKPVLVAGGYGMAALYLVACALKSSGTIFMGGRSAGDILCVDEFEAIDWDVRIATEDGSRGTRGFVTVALDEYVAGLPDAREVEYFACGPNAMLKAVCDRALANDQKAWLSVDRHMGCGVGACLVCVQRIRDPESRNGDWHWERVCSEGPVFESREIVWDDDE